MSKSSTRAVAVGVTGLALATSGCYTNSDDKATSTPNFGTPIDAGLGSGSSDDNARAASRNGTDDGAQGSEVGGTGTRTGHGCPVSVKALFATLKADNELYSRVNDSTTGLKDVTCVRGYATAITVVENADPVAVLFKYSSKAQSWKALNIGSSQICEDHVPDDVLPRLRNCG